MRDLVRHHPIPGIALSGYGMNDDIRDSMDAGFSRHITQPVDWQELKSAIQKNASEQAWNSLLDFLFPFDGRLRGFPFSRKLGRSWKQQQEGWLSPV